MLHKVFLAIERPCFFSFGYLGSHTGGSEKCRYTITSHHAPGSKRSLGYQFYLQFTGKQLALKLGVLANVTRYHLFYLAGLQHQANAKIIYTGIVRNTGKPFNAAAYQSCNTVFRYAAKTKAA